jgi:hypothetical protein
MSKTIASTAPEPAIERDGQPEVAPAAETETQRAHRLLDHILIDVSAQSRDGVIDGRTLASLAFLVGVIRPLLPPRD